MISIILPVYNAARFLNITVQTVLAQTYQDWELIAVDDGSTDGTPALLQAFARQDARIKVVTQANGGCAVARNTGVDHVAPEAKYVIFFDHDDLWEPDALQTLLETICARPQSVAAIGGVAKLDDVDVDAKFRALQEKAALLRQSPADTTPPVSDLKESDLKEVVFADTAVFCCAVTMGQVLIRRDALRKVGSLKSGMRSLRRLGTVFAPCHARPDDQNG